MKKAMLVLAVLAALPVGAWADVSKDELKRLVQAGISEDVIRTYLKINGPVAKLSSDDLIDLRSAGMSDRLLAELLVSGPNAAPAAPVPPAAAPPLPTAPGSDVAGPSVPPPYPAPPDASPSYPPSFYGSGYAASLGLLPYFVGVPVPVATPAVIVTTPAHPTSGHPPAWRPPTVVHTTTSSTGGTHH